MTSTEFTAGIGEGCRISSKVLKPPGGGSSDIFGLGHSCSAPNKSNSETSVNDSGTHSRLFGNSGLPPTTESTNQSTTFENGHQAQPARAKKVYVRRNPITGEEIEISLETENGDKNESDNKEIKEEAVNVPSKPLQTSIRIRNPPGGKSSGIF